MDIKRGQYKNSLWKKRLFYDYSKISLILIAIISIYSIGSDAGVINDSKNVSTVTESNNKSALADKISTNDLFEFSNKSMAVPNNICLTPTCIHTASKLLMDMDQSVHPCDNFYKFACGQYIKSTVIPDDASGINNFETMRREIAKLLKLSLEENSLPNEPKPIKVAKKLYQMCMNQTAIEAQGVKPLLEVLRNLGGWPVLEGKSRNESDFDWIELIFKFRDMGFDLNQFIRFDLTYHKDNHTKRIIKISKSPLSLIFGLFQNSLNRDIIETYYDYMVEVSVFLGADEEYAKNELLDSLNFEESLANISISDNNETRDSQLLYNYMTVGEMNEKFPSIPWKNILNYIFRDATINESDIVNVINPHYLTNFEKLITSVPRKVQANYALWKIVDELISYLPDKINEKKQRILNYILGVSTPIVRWKECLKTTLENLSIGVDSLYIKKYYNKNTTVEVMEMISYIQQRFYKNLENIDWMDEETKKKALDKAVNMELHIAFPQNLLNNTVLNTIYSDINLNSDSYLDNILKLSLSRTNHYFNSFRQPLDKRHWLRHPNAATVNAFYSSFENSIFLPAGILQGVVFDKDRPKYMNYGIIGSIIGHEIIHGFDDSGRKYDKHGYLIDWWNLVTANKFVEKVECMINQTNNFTVDDLGASLNGYNMKGEVIADNGGIKIAYFAYKDWEQSQNKPEPQLPGLPFTPRQMFWLNTANIWCSAYRPEYLKNFLNTRTHPPSEYRIIGSFQNIPEFSEDFECPVGSYMNPIIKCDVW